MGATEKTELIINGAFFVQRLTGVQRFAYETLKRLATDPELKIVVAVPENAVIPEENFGNCEFVRTGKFTGNLWEQWSLPRFCRKKKSPLLSMGSVAPVLYPSCLVLHDVIFEEDTSFKKTNASWVKKISAITRFSISRCKAVFTVSRFSAERIKHFYPKLKKDPTVVPVGCEHVYEMKAEKVDNIPEKFWFTVGSANDNKNFRYILALAKNNPQKNFLVSGKPSEDYSRIIKEEGIKNCAFTGYVSDGALKYLYERCEGFILPSFYEGFGAPPMEAIASGCRKIYLSDIPVFREVYGGCATFFDPHDYKNTVNLEECAATEEAAFEALLTRQSWENCAKIIADTVKQNKKN